MNHILFQLIVVFNYTMGTEGTLVIACKMSFHIISKHQPHAFLCVFMYRFPQNYIRDTSKTWLSFFVVQQHKMLNGIVTFNVLMCKEVSGECNPRHDHFNRSTSANNSFYRASFYTAGSVMNEQLLDM